MRIKETVLPVAGVEWQMYLSRKESNSRARPGP